MSKHYESFSFCCFFQVQEARGARREGVQQNTTREVRLGSRHGRQRLCFLILAFIRLQLASYSSNFSSHYACICCGIQFNLT